MILLAGGIDGGDRSTVLHNATQLAESPITVPIIYAGNKDAGAEAMELLRSYGKEVRTTENVLPRLQEINVEPARATIRRLYMERIVEAKGLNRAESFISNRSSCLLLPRCCRPPGCWQMAQPISLAGARSWSSISEAPQPIVHSVAPDPPGRRVRLSATAYPKPMPNGPSRATWVCGSAPSPF